MKSLFKQAFELLVGGDTGLDFLKVPKKRPLKNFTERDLIRLESEVGARLFGEVPKGHRREFFCLDDKTWIWFEEWTDENRKKVSNTIKYEIQEKGILKVQDGARYSYLEGDELKHFLMAIRLYYERVAREIYKVDPATGKKVE